MLAQIYKSGCLEISKIIKGHIVPAEGFKKHMGNLYGAEVLNLCECWWCNDNLEAVTEGCEAIILKSKTDERSND